jgi:hypothetical protein
MGPDLPAQNYPDIGKISVATRNLSTRGVPRPGSRGGGRGGVPIGGARNFAHPGKSKAKFNKIK